MKSKVSSYAMNTFKINQKQTVMEAILIPITFFLVIFGIYYLYYSTRNKERLALIEKGADASIFVHGGKPTIVVWKIVILNLALLLMGIGTGVLLGGILESFGVNDEVSFPGSIFMMAGLGLLIGFFLTKNMDKD